MEEEALKLKELGNEEFKEGNFFSAIQHYTEALMIKQDKLLYTNRAACLIKIKKY